MTPTPPDWPTVKRRHRPRLRRVAGLLAYDGTPFAGFQRQPDRTTVEGTLVEALMAQGLTGGLGFASRTDAGVHAAGQVIAFKIPQEAEPATMAAALAGRLPPEILLRALTWAPSGFHPRWSAIAKKYTYRVPSLDAQNLNEAALTAGIAALLASPGLSGFTAAGTDKTEAPPLRSLTAERLPDGALELRFRGPAFRRYAIRHMVGTLLAEARGELPPGSCAAVAVAPPPYRGPRASPGGLTLMEVEYPAELDPFRGITSTGPLRETAG